MEPAGAGRVSGFGNGGTDMPLCLLAIVLASTLMGAVRGSVKSAAGNTLPAATVTLNSGSGGTVRSAVTDSHGNYRFSDLPPGTYRAEAACRGYSIDTRHRIVLRAGSTIALDFVLQPLSKTSLFSLSAIRFYEKPELKMGQLTDPAAGGGYSDSASARGGEMVSAYLSSPGSAQAAALAPRRPSEDDTAVFGRLRQAAEEEPSEANLERWASALLARGNFSLAIEAFEQGLARYGHSARLWTGMGISLYSLGRYNEAVNALIRAARLNPAESQVYDFLEESCRFASDCGREVSSLFTLFLEMQPQNARAHYDYAMNLWRSAGKGGRSAALRDVESELKAAIDLNPRFADARLGLGALYDEERLTTRAISQYRALIRLQPSLAAAHYRLAQDYLRAGDSRQARAEFEIYEKLAQEKLAQEKR